MAQQIGAVTQVATATNSTPVVSQPASRYGNVETFFVTGYNGKVITATRQRKLDFSRARASRGYGYAEAMKLSTADARKAKKIREYLLKGYSIGKARREAASA